MVEKGRARCFTTLAIKELSINFTRWRVKGGQVRHQRVMRKYCPLKQLLSKKITIGEFTAEPLCESRYDSGRRH
jgi:hypothetical protein